MQITQQVALHLDINDGLLHWLDDLPGVTCGDATQAFGELVHGTALTEVERIAILPLVRLRAMELAKLRAHTEAEMERSTERQRARLAAESWHLPWERKYLEELSAGRPGVGKSGSRPNRQEVIRELLKINDALEVLRAEKRERMAACKEG